MRSQSPCTCRAASSAAAHTRSARRRGRFDSCGSCGTRKGRARQFEAARPVRKRARGDWRLAQNRVVVAAIAKAHHVDDAKTLAAVELEQMRGGIRRIERELRVAARGGPMFGKR